MFLSNENGEMLERLTSIIPNCKKVDIVVGYMTVDGFQLLSKAFEECIKFGGKIRILVGKPFENHNYQDCLDFIHLYRDRIEIRVSTMPNTLVHGKLYFLQQDSISEIIVGSSNLTYQGLVVNKEINIEHPISVKEFEFINQYLSDLYEMSLSISDYLKMSEDGKKMNRMLKKPNLDVNVMANFNLLAEKVFPNITQDQVNGWITESKREEEYFKSVLNEEALFNSGKWEGETFKQKFLMERVWAISESKHTELYAKVRKEPSDKLKNKILDMIEAINDNLHADEILDKGKLPNVLGVSTLSEILHKYDPKNFVIKNKRSHWGMAFVLDQGVGTEYTEGMTYGEFIGFVDSIYELFHKWLETKDIQGSIDHGNYLLDRFFYHLSEHAEYKEIISMFNRGRSNKWM